MVANFITSFDNISRLCGPKINFMSSRLYYITINIYHWHFLTVFLTKYKLNFVITFYKHSLYCITVQISFTFSDFIATYKPKFVITVNLFHSYFLF